MNKTIGIILGMVVLVGGIYLITRNSDENTIKDDTVNTPVNTEGRVVVSVTDAAANMSTISAIELKLQRVDLRSTLNGWVTVSSTPKTYSLLELRDKNQLEVFAQTNVRVGTYDQARFFVDEVKVKLKSGETKTAKLPSKEMTVNTMLAVSAGNTSSINFDFLASNSIFTTSDGEYVFAPVVKTSTQSSATLTVNSSGIVNITSGTQDSSTVAGMDIDGSVKADFKINSTQKFSIDKSGELKLDTIIR